MKLFVCGLVAETNSFACCPTGLGAFEAQGVRRSADSDADPMGMRSALEAVHAAAADAGWRSIEGVFAASQPLGLVVDAAYQALKAELIEGLRRAAPVDAVVLVLHGGMVAQTLDDCEGDLIAAVRAVVGPDVAVTAALDLHCHLTRQMVREADVLVAYKEYPDTDIPETAARAAELAIALAERRIRPVTAVAECRMMGLWPTLSGPMKAFVDRLRALEREGSALNISLGHGMAYGDVPEAGSKLWVTTDGDAAHAAALSRTLAAELFAIRDAITTRFTPLDEALGRLAVWDGDKPLALADTADNPGGGAMGDSTFLLRALADRKIGPVAVGGVWDPGAVQLCREAGAGARMTLRIGGKSGRAAGDPVDLPITVRAVRDRHDQDDFGARAALGPSAWVETPDGLSVVLISIRQQVLGVDLFTGLGLELTGLKGIVVKSMQHFLAAFAPHIGGVVHVDTPGLLRTDFEAIPFKRRDLNYWPRVADPFAQP